MTFTPNNFYKNTGVIFAIRKALLTELLIMSLQAVPHTGIQRAAFTANLITGVL